MFSKNLSSFQTVRKLEKPCKKSQRHSLQSTTKLEKPYKRHYLWKTLFYYDSPDG